MVKEKSANYWWGEILKLHDQVTKTYSEAQKVRKTFFGRAYRFARAVLTMTEQHHNEFLRLADDSGRQR